MVNGLPSKQKLRVRFPLPVLFNIMQTFKAIYTQKKQFIFKKSNDNSFFNLSKENAKSVSKQKLAIPTATYRFPYFSRKGNLERVEGNFQKFFEKQAIRFKKEKKSLPSSWFPSFFYAATAFVHLKTRRRAGGQAKFLKQKITYRPRVTGQRQSFLFFSKNFSSRQGASSGNSFRDRFKNQRENLLQDTRHRAVKKSGVQTGSGAIAQTLRQKRDEVHSRAYQIKPRF
jgi:hypothetical protein